MRLFLAGALGAVALAACATAETTAPAAEMTEASTNLVIIYSLKDGVSQDDFEAWVTSTDYPAMRGLDRVESFKTHRAKSLLPGTSEGAPSVQYIETFSIPDLDGFIAKDMGGQTVQSIMGQFMGFAEAPQFIVVEEID